MFRFLKARSGGVDVGEEANSAAVVGEAGRKRMTR